MRKYFGTDGVRGRVGTFPITPDFALRLGYAAGKVLASRRKKPAVIIGKDTRCIYGWTNSNSGNSLFD